MFVIFKFRNPEDKEKPLIPKELADNCTRFCMLNVWRSISDKGRVIISLEFHPKIQLFPEIIIWQFSDIKPDHDFSKMNHEYC